MYHFEFVSKETRAPVKDGLVSIIKETQNLLRNDVAFRYYFVGSDRRDMVTCDPKTNLGYDFDVNFEVSGNEGRYTPKEIKARFIEALNQAAPKYGYGYAEDSTRVITIKWKDRKNSRVLHSCDFAIVKTCLDGNGRKHRKYIHYNKAQNCYSWKQRPKQYDLLVQKAHWVSRNGYQEELRNLYLKKKNHNTNPNKKSRALYAEAVHEICQRHGFYT